MTAEDFVTGPSAQLEVLRGEAAEQDPLRCGTAALGDRVRQLLGEQSRIIIGLAGPPGAGKSTLAAALAVELDPLQAVVVPFDGFHLADAVLAERGLRHRKGAPDTFDVAGYASLLGRLGDVRTTVYAPTYDRGIEEPVAGAIAVPPPCRVVITEGNYLLLDEPELIRARQHMTEVWFVDLDDHTRTQRLENRHVAHGKTPDEARVWALGSDQENALVVAESRRAADRRIVWAG